jgi:general secretion pathway protein G
MNNFMKRKLGFTLIELIVVMAVIALLLTLAVPRYFNAIDNSKAAVQRQNIAVLRDSIDKFFGDNGRYPENLAELVSKRYLREVPQDPLTEDSNWVIVPPQDITLGAVYDIKSAYKLAENASDPTKRAERQQARDPGAPTANAPFEPEPSAPAMPATPALPASPASAAVVKS